MTEWNDRWLLLPMGFALLTDGRGHRMPKVWEYTPQEDGEHGEIAREDRAAIKEAMSILSYKDRTEWELRDKMRQKEFSPEEIDRALEYVTSYHYIDDMRYATRFIEFHHHDRSRHRLRQDLQKRHVPDEYISLALEESETDDIQALRDAIRKLKRPGHIMDYDEKQKLAAKLYRRGFRVQDIKKELDF